MVAPVIAVDGPSGVGKGTLCRLLATHYGWQLLDSGALYRLTALAASRHAIALDDAPALATLAQQLDVVFEARSDAEPLIRLEGEVVNQAIRTEQAGMAASQVAAIGAVRAALLQRQRDFRQPPGLVADGRDMGTVVFPDAPVKIFLDASAEVRAQRRYQQLKQQGVDVTLDVLVREIADRDARDRQRAVAPLQAAADAITIDTSNLSITAVLERTKAVCDEHFAATNSFHHQPRHPLPYR